ncbi:MAG: mono/diheme cytochrome c family protein [Pseudohongiellaceae bacterium]|jgi:mono/diheme cytochrome c family protein
MSLYYSMKNYRCNFTLISLIAMASSAHSNEHIEGEKLFNQNCVECHQSNGQGIANIYPALAGSEVVKGSPADVALILIIGRGEMPAFAGAISDGDLAKIINYVSNAWGNEGELITAQMIELLK